MDDALDQDNTVFKLHINLSDNLRLIFQRTLHFGARLSYNKYFSLIFIRCIV